MSPKLDRYQKEACRALMKIVRQHGGASSGTTSVSARRSSDEMLIERLVPHERKNVVLFAPKATREGVWEPHIRDWLKHIGGVGGGVSNHRSATVVGNGIGVGILIRTLRS